MNLIVDANVVIACLISSESKVCEFFFSDNLCLIAPEYLKEELEKHKTEITQKSGLTISDFDLALAILSSRITFVPLSDFRKFIPKAQRICPDPNDVEYFALALKTGSPLWSNDKKLKEQKVVTVLSTAEIFRLF